jgi:outer membrane receptor protein involved in Fe transport
MSYATVLKPARTNRFFVASFALFASTAMPWQAFAQADTKNTSSTAQPSASDEAEDSKELIVVTGSRIKRINNEDSPIPITAIDANDLLRGSGSSLGDTLNNLPALRSTFSLGNSSRFIGTAGVNFLDLRGLGTQRTLVLINGRRQVGSLQGSSELDVNTISQALLERVEVITGGASAIYGSDAVSGVVNFITKKDFNGFYFNGEIGTSTSGGADQTGIAVAYGRNFNEGRGNVAVSLEYDYRQKLDNSERSFSRNNDSFTANPANINTDNDAIPDLIFVPNTRSIAFSDGGTLCQSSNCRTLGIFRFRPDGSLTAADLGVRDFRRRDNGATNGARITQGGDGSNFNRTGELVPETRRYAANLLVNYDFSPAFKFSGEGKFVRTNSRAFSSPAFNGLGNQITVSLDNPFLTTQALATIAANNLAPDGSFNFQRNNVDFGSRGEDNERDLYRFSGALSGDVTDHLNYELAYTYSRASLKLASLNNRVEQRFVNAVDAVRDTAGVLGTPGAIVCRSTLLAGNRSSGNFDVDNCVPVNVFGEGQPSTPAVNFINVTSQTRNILQQNVVTGFISGDSGGFFKLPGGPIGVVIGFEYRRDSSRFDVPDRLNGVPGDTTGINLLKDGLTFLNALQTERGAIDVVEGFAELNVPLLRNVPFAKELSFDAAFRYANYSTKQVGGVYAFKVGGQYAPVDDIRFRASYSRAVRAPNVTELFGPDVQNFFGVVDPCDINNIGSGSSTRAANCAALGIPSGFNSDLTSTPEGTSGGNPNLREETSRSFTAGVVVKPRFIKGFTFSADYYRFNIKKAISSVAAQDILDQCVDAATINNAFCPLVDRAGTATPGIAQFNIAFIRQRSLNFSGLKASGIDFETNYRIGLGKIGNLSLRNLTTYVITRNDFPFITEPNRPDRFLSELGDPRYLSNFTANLKTGNLNINYELRYIGNQLQTGVNAEDVKSVGGNPPENPDAQDRLTTGDAFYHSVRLSYDLQKDTDIFVSVDNIANRRPPAGILGSESGGAGVYDSIGRFVSIGVTAKF